jgi:glycosyltransferase involved in cell wall biosynthesis
MTPIVKPCIIAMVTRSADEPLVSFIIPVYNRSGMVHEAVASAISSVRDVPFEVVIVDDASTDDTWESLRVYEGDPRVRCVRQEQNGGQSAARNRGLDEARGLYAKFLDSDDLLLPHVVKEIEAALAEKAEIVVSGWIEETADGARVWDAPTFTSVADDLLAGRGVTTSAALYVRRADWRWDPGLRKLDDWDYFCQAALGTNCIVSVPGSAYVLRRHEEPRVTDVSLLAHAREHYRVLAKLEERLEREGCMTDARRARLAQYLYKELRVLCLHDHDAFESIVVHLFELDRDFAPRDEEGQHLMRVAARVLGVRNAVRLHSFLKRTVAALRLLPRQHV